MKLNRLGAPLFVAASLAMLLPASAAPLPHLQPQSDALVMPVGGCHSNVRSHFVPEFGRRASHFHRRNCRPVLRETAGRDCHRNVRRHYLPQYGGSVVHRHVGSNCRVRVLRRYSGPSGGFCVRIGPIRYCER